MFIVDISILTMVYTPTYNCRIFGAWVDSPASPPAVVVLGFKRRQKLAEIAGEADPARTLRPYAGRLKDPMVEWGELAG